MYLQKVNIDKIRQAKTFGNSMLPFLLEGDVVYWKKITFSRIQPQDIITFYRDNQLITHRVIYKASNYLIARGDNRLKSDGRVYKRQILGRVSHIKRGNEIFDLESIYLLQSTVYIKEILLLKNAFVKKNVLFVFLKGLPIHLFYEKKYPKKIYADCDILIARECFGEINDIFKQLGYQLVLDESLKTRTKFNHIWEVSFRKNVNGVLVVFDIHLYAVFLTTQLGPLSMIYPQKLLDQLSRELLINHQIATINNSSFPILPAEYLAVYLGLHIFHHNYKDPQRYLLYINIISRLSKHQTKRMVRVIKEYQLTNYIYPTFVIIKRYFKHSSTSVISYLITETHSLISSKNNSRNYMDKFSNKVNIFDEETRIQAGIRRVWYIFWLSPNPMFVKWLFWFKPEVWSAFYIVASRRIFNTFSFLK